MFNITLEKEIEQGDVKLTQDGDKVKMFIGEEKFSLRDDMRYISYYCKRLDDLEFNSILILGLGLGVVPYYLENFKGKTDIDVIENNKNVIDITTSLNHLNHTNVIEGECYTHNIDKKYDLILVDFFWNKPRFFRSRMIDIQQNYKNNINNGGMIYIPLSDDIIYL